MLGVNRVHCYCREGNEGSRIILFLEGYSGCRGTGGDWGEGGFVELLGAAAATAADTDTDDAGSLRDVIVYTSD
jgi:hypothetical protein